MQYAAIVTREGSHWLATFPGCNGCQTFADSEEKLRVAAQEALAGWLEAHLVEGQAPPLPSAAKRKPAKGTVVWWVDVPIDVAVPVQLRWARQRAKLSQKDLGRRAGVGQQQIAKLERPGENPTLGTLTKVATALGGKIRIRLDMDE